MKEIFPGLIGNTAVKDHIGKDIADGINSHAYIIEGAEGSGKRMIAKLIASAVSCENRSNPAMPLPCGICDNCRRIAKDISSDVVHITKEDKASIGIDSVRRIREGLYVTPNDSSVRTYVIHESELMTPQAQNALLLTLEEPPTFIVFVLLTTDASKLLETVRSRAQLVRTESFSANVVSSYIETTDKGKLLLLRDSDSFAATVALSGGSIGRALQLINDSDESKELMKNRAIVADLIPLICKGKAAHMIRALSGISIKSNTEALSILILIDNAVRDMMAVKKSESPTLSFYISRDEAMRYASEASVRKLATIHSEVCSAITKLNANVTHKTVLTDMIIRISRYKR